jgi:hypothetical protein
MVSGLDARGVCWDWVARKRKGRTERTKRGERYIFNRFTAKNDLTTSNEEPAWALAELNDMLISRAIRRKPFYTPRTGYPRVFAGLGTTVVVVIAT